MNLPPVVRVGHQTAPSVVPENLRIGMDVVVVIEHARQGRKGLVRHDAQAVRVGDERVSLDAGSLLIGLAESAIDDDQPSIGLDGAFAAADMDGRMAVNDVRLG